MYMFLIIPKKPKHNKMFFSSNIFSELTSLVQSILDRMVKNREIEKLDER